MLKVQEIREIIKLIDQSTINEFTYELDGAKVSMKKTSDGEVIQIPQQTVNKTEQPKQVQEVEQTAPKEEKVESSAPAVENPANQEAKKDYDYEIVSPMVGTLYSAESPEKDPYVQTGSKVANDTVVCIVEAMKLFNEIEAEVSGEIVEILVEDGELVEYGQPLFRVKAK
ncbi:acetyl-CoA carboxylase, biotin carboxyl carrier protein [Virgibacillus phasianinus]|uniref:Biotin carboxyl carrier protein of acetyl-CoA carboxylase n=1 Tax=Virgibacillus phasianinus TaxID=2017483 RepID=A0A220U5B8_9BACI|nr:acetyl-CoA carboxylase biotin carboxyl carrier protein [Virgibacillus phasianinus]ASK63235.1 acetyl-CoA carboxylase, biotin carboxyl carrier protein [Virgibacillus phasianinus]